MGESNGTDSVVPAGEFLAIRFSPTAKAFGRSPLVAWLASHAVQRAGSPPVAGNSLASKHCHEPLGGGVHPAANTIESPTVIASIPQNRAEILLKFMCSPTIRTKIRCLVRPTIY